MSGAQGYVAQRGAINESLHTTTETKPLLVQVTGPNFMGEVVVTRKFLNNEVKKKKLC